jgi:hypothetical protein
VLHRAPSGLLSSHLCRVRRRLTRPLETNVAGRCPGDRIAALIGDGHDRVVERTLDVCDAMGDVLTLTLTWAPSPCGWLSHLLDRLLLAGHRLLGALTGASIGVGALAANGQTLAVTDALVAANLHFALDVL